MAENVVNPSRFELRILRSKGSQSSVPGVLERFSYLDATDDVIFLAYGRFGETPLGLGYFSDVFRPHQPQWGLHKPHPMIVTRWSLAGGRDY